MTGHEQRLLYQIAARGARTRVSDADRFEVLRQLSLLCLAFVPVVYATERGRVQQELLLRPRWTEYLQKYADSCAQEQERARSAKRLEHLAEASAEHDAALERLRRENAHLRSELRRSKASGGERVQQAEDPESEAPQVEHGASEAPPASAIAPEAVPTPESMGPIHESIFRKAYALFTLDPRTPEERAADKELRRRFNRLRSRLVAAGRDVDLDGGHRSNRRRRTLGADLTEPRAQSWRPWDSD